MAQSGTGTTYAIWHYLGQVQLMLFGTIWDRFNLRIYSL